MDNPQKLFRAKILMLFNVLVGSTGVHFGIQGFALRRDAS